MTYGNYPDRKKIKKVLVIKLRHHGDVLLTTPVFSNLRKALPSAQIDAFIYTDTLPMLDGHPDISSFILYDKNWKKLSLFHKLGKELSLLWKIRCSRYDLVINLTEGDRGLLAARFSGALYTVGPEGKRYTHPVAQIHRPRHTVEKQLDAIRRIGIFPTPEERSLFFSIPIAAMHKIFQQLPPSFVLIHPVSRWRFKCLAPRQIASLIRALHAKGETIALSSGPDAQELAMIDEILGLIPDVPVKNFSGKTTLKELGALVAQAKILITVDSVPLHLASALKTPVVALFGPSSEKNWGPWQHPRSAVVAQNFSCRPCYRDGCGGSKMSDCLFTMPQGQILDAFDKVSTPQDSTKPTSLSTIS